MSTKRILVLGGGFDGSRAQSGRLRKLDEIGQRPDPVEVKLGRRALRMSVIARPLPKFMALVQPWALTRGHT